ncbi:hypothetical protein LTR10_021383 [Elasticomyces elasticus]|uniref:Two-component system protein A n=1 Tax=Exophiala sideris TaxID=1016849 RepID=A0ABR0JGV4_9EURO|nr:hypothetical protein LTR10_021383 [Elasticomyces elasticus]KAK5033397.1 hypothetical protein LTS07_003700 [Exophiala sideris]KAK5042108.1 hypothetical protein LTR13_001914 [Exophiala sideris]KAK5063941.1 hypothetical protein LTR69_003708 [Exophiala sideris]KAK5185376.1 hypothetical protein LTR44_002365 [Eurotiomycetes sp. CCFEE 6388]
MKAAKRIAVEEIEDAVTAIHRKPYFPASFVTVTPLATDSLSPPPSPMSTQGCDLKKLSGMERIFTLSPNPCAVLDKDLRIVTVSRSYQKVFNLTPDECDGKSFFDVLGKVLSPTNMAMTVRLVQDAINLRKEQRSDPIAGNRLPGYWRLRVTPIYDVDELLYVLTEAVDASEDVKRTLDHYAQLSVAETYRILVSTLRDYAIFMLDPTGCITTWNTGAMLLKHYTQDEIIGRHFSTFYSEDDRKARKPEKELEIALRDGKVEDEGWRFRKDGTGFWANVIITPVYRDGELRGFSKITRDLTERKAAEARLIEAYEEASKMKSDFLANMSHEIRTPMHGMLSALSLLTDTRLTAEQKELTDIIDESGAVLLQVINDILDYSKLSSGSFTISREIMNVSDVVDAVRRAFNVGTKNDLDFQVELDPRLPTFVQSDPLRYRQILQNLVSNAIKFTEHGYVRVKVVVEYEDESSWGIRTEVIDTGIGVSGEAENVLFTPFAQLDNSPTKRYKGTGLGLSICKSLSELMGGTIGFAQNSEQQGSNFHFTLKMNKVDTPATPPPVEAPDINLKDVAPHKTLLLVEDNAINQTIMVRQLRSFGFEKVDVAGDGAVALRLIKQKPLTYSLVLMDISMPVMDGVTATKELRAMGYNVPIIAMTANALKGDEEAYLAEGMNDYVAKPVDRRLLTQALMRWLR